MPPHHNPVHHPSLQQACPPLCAQAAALCVQVNGWLEELDSDAASLPPPPPPPPPPPQARAATASSAKGGSSAGGGSRAPLDAPLSAADLGRRKQVTFVYPSPTKAHADADAVLRSGVLGAYAHAVSPKQPAE